MSTSESQPEPASLPSNGIVASASGTSSNDAIADATGATSTPGATPTTYQAPVKLSVHALKYHTQIAQFNDCPPKGTGGYGIGYRVCFADPKHAKNFLPNAIADLSRQDGRAPVPCCSSYAVSLYTTLPALVKKTKAILKTNPKFLLKKGDHYAEVKLEVGDGRSTVATNDGHFDFFEYAGFNAVARINNHAKMVL